MSGSRPTGRFPFQKAPDAFKGTAGIEFQQGLANRLNTSPTMDGNGQQHLIDCAVATREIGQRMAALIEQYEPRSVAIFVGTGAYANTLGYTMARSLFGATGSPNYFSTLTIDQSSHNVTASRMGVYPGGEPLPEDVDVALVSGMNPLVGHLGYPLASVDSFNPGKNSRTPKSVSRS